MIDAYSLLNKKIIDENNYMKEEIEKIEMKKSEALMKLKSLGS